MSEAWSKRLILVRGLPGAGKTTSAKDATDILRLTGREVAHLETDQFLVDDDGVYRWTPERSKRAHRLCQFTAEQMLPHVDTLIVSNTFTRGWEAGAYFDMAERHSADLVVVTVGPALETYDPSIDTALAQRNVHGVSTEKIRQMRERWEPTPVFSRTALAEVASIRERRKVRNVSYRRENPPLDCDCYAGCWGVHVREQGWSSLQLASNEIAEEAYRLVHQDYSGDPLPPESRAAPLGGYVLIDDTLWFASQDSMINHMARLRDFHVIE